MKKICIILMLCLLLTLSACRPAEEQDDQYNAPTVDAPVCEIYGEGEPTTATFEGIVWRIREDCILVKVMDEEEEQNICENIFVSTNVSSDEPLPELKCGYRIEVCY